MRIIFYSLTVFLSFIILYFGYNFIFRLIYPLKHEDIVYKFSNMYKVDKELIFAIIKCESGFDDKAHSKANAYGLMQITPETFDWLKVCYTHDEELEDCELEIPEVNILYGTLLISLLLKKYSDEAVALSAYNAGISAVDRWLKNKEFSSDGLKLNYIPYKETRNYVKKVEKAKKMYKRLYFK